MIGGTTDGDWDGELTGYADFFSVALDEDGSELWRFQVRVRACIGTLAIALRYSSLFRKQ